MVSCSLKHGLLNQLVLTVSAVWPQLSCSAHPTHLPQSRGTPQLRWLHPRSTAINHRHHSLWLLSRTSSQFYLCTRQYSLSAATQKCTQRTNTISSTDRKERIYVPLRTAEPNVMHTGCATLPSRRNCTLRAVAPFLEITYCKKTKTAANNQASVHWYYFVLCYCSCFPLTPEQVTSCQTAPAWGSRIHRAGTFAQLQAPIATKW